MCQQAFGREGLWVPLDEPSNPFRARPGQGVQGWGSGFLSSRAPLLQAGQVPPLPCQA